MDQQLLFCDAYQMEATKPWLMLNDSGFSNHREFLIVVTSRPFSFLKMATYAKHLYKHLISKRRRKKQVLPIWLELYNLHEPWWEWWHYNDITVMQQGVEFADTNDPCYDHKVPWLRRTKGKFRLDSLLEM